MGQPRHRLVLVAALGCHHSAPPAPPVIENRTPVPAGQPAVAKSCKLEGIVFDSQSGDLLAGATVVMSGYRVQDEVVITDEQGTFSATMRPPHRDLHVYYADRGAQIPVSMAQCDHRIRVPFDPHGPELQRLPVIYDSP